MKYDFETLQPRKDVGSNKWDAMYQKNKRLPENVVPFSVADMEFKNPPQIAEGIYGYLKDTIMGYTGPTDAYYDAIIRWMGRRHNWNVEKEWIVDYPGVVPALYHLVQVLTKPGEGVILFTPVYYPFFDAVKMGARRLVESRLALGESGYGFDFEDFEEKARDPKNTLCILCNPHNPVGRVWSRRELERIGQICMDHGVMVISDEIHHDLIMPGYEHTVFAGISEEFAQQSITCTAPSKTFNTAGLMTSNVIVPNGELREQVLNYRKKQAVFSCNLVGYKACEIVYNQCEDWLEELLVVLDANRKMVKSFFSGRLPQVRVFELEGTYLQWLDFRALGLGYQELEQFMVKEAWLFTDEGYIFGEAGEGFERINLACPSWVLREALERFYGAWMRRRGK